MKKKWVVITVVSVLLIGGGYWAYQQFKTQPQTASTITTKVRKGDVKKEITATGSVRYPEELSLAFKQGGTVQEIYVKAGDSVKAGQALAKLDPTSLEQAVVQAEASLKDAEINWQQQQLGAQATVVKAEQALKTAEQAADPAYLTHKVFMAEQSVAIASDELAKAQQSGNASSILSAQNSLAQAQANLTAAQNDQNGGAAQAVETAQAELTIAQAKLAQLATKSVVAQTQNALDTAKTNLANATLTAPADGVVINMALTKGQTVNSSTAAMTLATGGNLFLVGATVSQEEITELKVGQKTDITLDSAPNEHISGTLIEVALKGTTTQNVTMFGVTLQIDESSDLLRAGMNVNVTITVGEAKDVLVLPSQAITTRGNEKGVFVPNTSQAGQSAQSGKATQPIQSSQSAQRSQGSYSSAAGTPTLDRKFVSVEIGLDDGTNVEIKSGLTEGQEVILSNRTATTTTSQNRSTSDRGSWGGGGIPGISGPAGR